MHECKKKEEERKNLYKFKFWGQSKGGLKQ